MGLSTIRAACDADKRTLTPSLGDVPVGELIEIWKAHKGHK